MTQKNDYFFITLFFIFISINIVKTQLLNNIIELGGENFRYSHFSFNQMEI